MKKEWDAQKLIARMGLRRSAKREVAQYAKGLKDGIRMACASMGRSMQAAGREEGEIRSLLGPLLARDELERLLAELGKEAGKK